jgi:hypothetical protein
VAVGVWSAPKRARCYEAAAHAGLIHAIDATGTRYRFSAPYLRAAIRQTLNPTRRAYLQAQLGALPNAQVR